MIGRVLEGMQISYAASITTMIVQKQNAD